MRFTPAILTFVVPVHILQGTPQGKLVVKLEWSRLFTPHQHTSSTPHVASLEYEYHKPHNKYTRRLLHRLHGSATVFALVLKNILFVVLHACIRVHP